MADNLYQFLLQNEISEASLRPLEGELQEVLMSEGAEVLLTWINRTKALTPSIINQAFGEDSRLNIQLSDVDDEQNNILHIIFDLMLHPSGCYLLKPRDKLPLLINELFIALVSAVTQEFTTFFREIFSEAFSVQLNNAERTALDILLESGAYQIMFAGLLFDQKRLSLGSNLNFLHCGGGTAHGAHLASAAREGNFEALCVLLAFNHGPNCSVNDVTPLIEAVRSDSPFAPHAAAALLSASADPNFATGPLHESPLHFLSESTAPLIFCELFSEFKAEMQQKDANGESPLIKAARRNNFRAVQALCSRGALDCANDHGETALMIAVQNKNLQIAIELIQRGRSSVNSVAADRRTVADYLDCTNLSFVELLFGAGLKVPRTVRQNVEKYKECDVYMRQYAKTIKKIGAFKQTNIVQLDAFVSKCSLCEENFSFMRRRSHCRVCGKIICRRCYTLKLLRDSDGRSSKQKVCIYCKNFDAERSKTSETAASEVENLVEHISRVRVELQAIIEQYSAQEHFELSVLFAELATVFLQVAGATGWREIGQMVV